MKFILGNKEPMTQIWKNDKLLAVTPLKAGPCVVAKIKTKNKDSYSAVALAFGERKAKNLKKPFLGQFKDLGITPRYLKEFRLTEDSNISIGSVVKVDTFEVGEKVDVIGTSKGKGFQGVVKRHGFAGFRKTHGNKDQLRAGGSVGPKGPAHVFKNTRMPGQMGNERVTVSNLKIVEIDIENNLIYLQGAVPGCIGSLVMVKNPGELKVHNKEEKPATEEEVVVSESEEKKEEESIVEEIKEEEKKD